DHNTDAQEEIQSLVPQNTQSDNDQFNLKNFLINQCEEQSLQSEIVLNPVEFEENDYDLFEKFLKKDVQNKSHIDNHLPGIKKLYSCIFGNVSLQKQSFEEYTNNLILSFNNSYHSMLQIYMLSNNKKTSKAISNEFYDMNKDIVGLYIKLCHATLLKYKEFENLKLKATGCLSKKTYHDELVTLSTHYMYLKEYKSFIFFPLKSSATKKIESNFINYIPHSDNYLFDSAFIVDDQHRILEKSGLYISKDNVSAFAKMYNGVNSKLPYTLSTSAARSFNEIEGNHFASIQHQQSCDQSISYDNDEAPDQLTKIAHIIEMARLYSNEPLSTAPLFLPIPMTYKESVEADYSFLLGLQENETSENQEEALEALEMIQYIENTNNIKIEEMIQGHQEILRDIYSEEYENDLELQARLDEEWRQCNERVAKKLHYQKSVSLLTDIKIKKSKKNKKKKDVLKTAPVMEKAAVTPPSTVLSEYDKKIMKEVSIRTKLNKLTDKKRVKNKVMGKILNLTFKKLVNDSQPLPTPNVVGSHQVMHTSSKPVTVLRAHKRDRTTAGGIVKGLVQSFFNN
ncbi:MAG: hypothetical protein H0U27_02560, partial [Nitrosopumilus sp.]|nr:hypothetical protein [Nitrosopumilus sp.]